MTAPFTRAQLDARKRADAYADPVAEMRRRWPDTEWELNAVYDPRGVVVRRFVYGLWTRSGVECGLRSEVPVTAVDGDQYVLEARAFIARHAIFSDECRRGDAIGS